MTQSKFNFAQIVAGQEGGRPIYPLAPTQTFAFELKDTAAFGFEPHLTGKKKLAPKLSVRTTGARSPGVPVRASKLNFG